ncbi:hypothetical protein [Actinoplanes derwentensis]|uniref:Uncharacterized protein n=1 Tax=Actinoplanes derwentensis TaxID=113562 RepID=A0A1H2BWU7_9ACTN|nr:hypothetical protein [Actinoplanes derwentensis]GID83159.1 hypothetical protein Ade03nite_20830 [Actinoplanes derwentensis]SDT62537.1 hypothetical protein SAMN04489716_4964 [Actinoplanes derwentensis]
MTAPGNGILYFILTLCIVVSSGYAVGRIHQWHRHGLERDEAYRTGYDQASRSIIGMMAERRATSVPAPIVNPPHVRRTVFNQRTLYPDHEQDRRLEDIQFRTSR